MGCDTDFAMNKALGKGVNLYIHSPKKKENYKPNTTENTTFGILDAFWPTCTPKY